MRRVPFPGDMEEDYNFDEDFLELIQKCKVPENLYQVFSEKDFTSIGIFAFAFVEEDALEQFIQHIGTLNDDPPNWGTSSSAASIRHLHHCCRKATSNTGQNERKNDDTFQQSADSRNLLELAWADLPPVRVKEGDFIAMKKEFTTKYPSESLSSTNIPCARLIASLMQQKSRKAFSWIPWKELLSESRWLDIQEKGKKRQKLEGIILYDVVAEIEDDELSGAPFFIQGILETRAIALALTKICHLSVGKKYITTFMKLYTARSSDSGLRPPSLKEAQCADKEFWAEVFRMVNEEAETWDMESAVTEVLQVKNLLSIHMMPRPKTLKGKGNGKGKNSNPIYNPKGKGKGKGKGKSFWDKSGQAKKTWQSNWGKNTADGSQFCHRFHLFNTCTSPQCRFSHTCPVLVNGKVCGQKHRAYDHPKGKN